MADADSELSSNVKSRRRDTCTRDTKVTISAPKLRRKQPAMQSAIIPDDGARHTTMRDGSGEQRRRFRPKCAVTGAMAALALIFEHLSMLSVAADTRILRVGPGLTFATPSAAAAVAQSGDTIEIAPGTYRDCAVWPAGARGLTITAAAGGAVAIADRTCEGKAIFVVKGDNVTVRGITFTGAKVPNHNGAGIRAEARNLTVEDSKFLDNEEGMLAGALTGSTIIVRGSYFKGNGNCLDPAGCAHGIYAGNIDRLIVENSTFIEQHIGHHIKSRAERTELVGNTIQDGQNGNSSYLVDIPDGGALIMRNNILQKGPLSDNPSVAVTLGEESNRNATPEIVIENNQFTNHLPRETTFVRNLTGRPAVLRGNGLTGPVRPLDELRP